MAGRAMVGIDIGTSSSKGVLVGLDGDILAQAVRGHRVSRPRPGHVEMDAAIWWDECASISRELASIAASTGTEIAAVGVSGMGPCVLIADDAGEPLRPAILYGVDTRATEQIAALNAELGEAAIMARGHAALSSQAVGPKLRWLADHEPDALGRARRLFMPASWLAWKLTGAYGLDHHSASQSWPMYDAGQLDWYGPWADALRGGIELPPLRWPGEVAGTVTQEATESTGIPTGIPVITGTIDAWSEAVSVGATRVGDLMLMYGSTMFLIATVAEPVTSPALWGTVGAEPGTRSLAAGMATSGAITDWLRELFGEVEPGTLIDEAAASGPGANGLLMLPYFAGERTPIQDPDARGLIVGLTLSHTRGDLYRAALEATAFGVRHNVEAMRDAGVVIDRVVAVGGGAQGSLWTQIVSDVTGLDQSIPTHTVGASLGAAFLAARTQADVDIATWNPPLDVRRPDPSVVATYDEAYAAYRALYPATRDVVHALAAMQHSAAEPTPSRAGPEGAPRR